MNTLEILSYAANIVFVTWGIVDYFARQREKNDSVNYLNAGYEMAARFSRSLQDEHTKGQAEDIQSFLKSATMNAMRRTRDEIPETAPRPKESSIAQIVTTLQK